MSTTTDALVAEPRAESLRAVAVAAVPLLLGALLLAEALALPTTWLPLQEAAVADRLRGRAGEITGPLLPLVLSPLRDASGATLLDVGRLFGVACWTGLFAPAYALARRSADRGPACAAGALTVLVPAAVYSGALVPEALGTLLAACAFWLEVSASERGSVGRLGGAVALGVLAALTRPWFAAVPVAVLAAYVLPRVRRPRPFDVAVGLGACYALYYSLAAVSPALATAVAHPGDVLRSALGSAGAVALGFGVVPAVLAVARLSRGPVPVALATGTVALAFAAGLSGGGQVDDRPLVALAPLVFALACGGIVSGWRLVVASVAVAAAVLFVRWPSSKPTLEHASTLAFVRGLFGARSAGPALAALFALACVLLVLLPGVWRALALGGVVLALVPGGELVAWVQARHQADLVAAGQASPRDWVDRAVGGSTHVTLVRSNEVELAPEAQAELEFWNRSISQEAVIDPGSADPKTGVLATNATPQVALAVGLDLVGRVIARGPQGAVVRVELPLRLPPAGG